MRTKPARGQQADDRAPRTETVTYSSKQDASAPHSGPLWEAHRES